METNAALAVTNSLQIINQFCNELLIQIHRIDIQQKDIIIEIINNTSVNQNSEEYKKLKRFSQSIIITLDKVMREIDSENLNYVKDISKSKNW